MLNNNKNQKIIIIAIAAIIILALNYNFIVSPTINDFKQLKKDFNDNLSTIADLKDKTNRAKELEKEKEMDRYLFNQLSQKLPSYLVPEKYVVYLKDIILKNKLTVEGLTFTNPVEYNADGVKIPITLQGEAVDRSDKLISGFFTEQEASSKKATESELQYASIGNEKPFKVDIDINFKGKEADVRSFVYDLENSSQFVTINSIKIGSGDDSGAVTGQMSTSFYGFKDSKVPTFSLWDDQLKKGKADIFGDVGSGNAVNGDGNFSDFNIRLSPVTYDIPSVIISKSRKNGTEIYGKNDGYEKSEIYVIERNGKFYYKYKTQSVAYPATYIEEEFKPLNTSNIVIRVYSIGRVGENDKNGIMLTIYNKTSREIKVVPFEDDVNSPRLKYEIK